MNIRLWTVLLGAVVVFGLALHWFGSPDAMTTELSPVEDRSGARDTSLIGNDEPSPDLVGGANEDARAGAVLAQPAASGDSPEIDRDRDLHGIVVDPQDQPVAGAEVQVVRDASAEYGLLDPVRSGERQLIAETHTDEGGRFAIPLEPGRPYELGVHAEGFADARLPHRYAGEQVRVELGLGATLYGLLSRADDGGAVAGAGVRLRPRHNDGARNRVSHKTVTDANGAWRYEKLPAGPYRLDFAPVDAARPSPIEIDLVAGQQLERNVSVPAGNTIRGRVIDAVSRNPIRGAEVGEGWTFQRAVRTDASGEYVFAGFSDNYLELTARAEGYGQLDEIARSDLDAPAARVVDFELQPERRVSGTVVDAQGDPIADAYVAATASMHDNRSQHTDWLTTRSAADGSFHIRNLRPDLPHSLFVKRDGYGTVVYDFPADELERSTIDLGQIVLPDPARVSGRVLDENDGAGADLMVELIGTNADRRRLAGDAPAPTWSLDGYVAARKTRTDDLGRFSFGNLASGRYKIRVRLGEMHEAVEHELDVKLGEHAGDIELRILRGLSIAGQVSVGDGGRVPQVYVSFDPEHGGASADSAAEPDGRFEAQGLTPGTYTLSFYPYASLEDKAAGRNFATAKLKNVHAGDTNVTIQLEPRTPNDTNGER